MLFNKWTSLFIDPTWIVGILTLIGVAKQLKALNITLSEQTGAGLNLGGPKNAPIPSHSCLGLRLSPCPLFSNCYDATSICSDNLSSGRNDTKKCFHSSYCHLEKLKIQTLKVPIITLVRNRDQNWYDWEVKCVKYFNYLNWHRFKYRHSQKRSQFPSKTCLVEHLALGHYSGSCNDATKI